MVVFGLFFSISWLSLVLDEWDEIVGDLGCDQLLWTGNSSVVSKFFGEEAEGSGASDDEIEDAFD